jgi:hypothetical protein
MAEEEGEEEGRGKGRKRQERAVSSAVSRAGIHATTHFVLSFFSGSPSPSLSLQHASISTERTPLFKTRNCTRALLRISIQLRLREFCLARVSRAHVWAAIHFHALIWTSSSTSILFRWSNMSPTHANSARPPPSLHSIVPARPNPSSMDADYGPATRRSIARRLTYNIRHCGWATCRR